MSQRDRFLDSHMCVSQGTCPPDSFNSTNEGKVTVAIDSGSIWTLTGDSYISSLNGSLSQIDLNGYHLYVDGVEVR